MRVAVHDTGSREEVPHTRQRAHPWRWIAAVAVLAIVGMALFSMATNPGFRWHIVGQYMFHPQLVRGLWITGLLTVIAMSIGIALGTIIALMRLSENRVLSVVGWTYTWVFRSVPVLVQLIIWYNLGALYSTIRFGIPFGPALFEATTNDFISPLTASILGLGLSQAAYTGEVIRAGIVAVPRGQTKAAMALGMTSSQTFFRIVLPQAMRLIIPPVGNEVISMVKNTSLVSVIALADLLYSAQLIYSRNYQTIPLLLVASIWYLGIVSILSVGQYFLERRFRQR